MKEAPATMKDRAIMRKPILEVRGLSKHFPVYGKGFFQRVERVVKAVDKVSFDLLHGETLSLVGESGSGKTTTVRTILRALSPTSGSAIFHDNGNSYDLSKLNEAELRALRPKMQMIFQDPFASLNPRMTVGRIVGEPLLIHKMAKGSELVDRVDDMLVRVGLKKEHRIRYPHAFSGGQRQRIGIARALIMHPKLVVADEAVSALDVSVQAQVINLLEELQGEFGLTYIFVAHDLSVVKHISDRVAVMYAGRIVELTERDKIFDRPRHPYTRALMASVPNPDPDIQMDLALGGDVADPGNLPEGCSFHPRCSACKEQCKQSRPELKEVEPGWWVACHKAGD
jgi:oligopeptide/dipeptide ABC transporter ATP-binding protein